MQILGINNYYQPKYQQQRTIKTQTLQTQPSFNGGTMQVYGFKNLSRFKNIENPINKAFYDELKEKMSSIPEPDTRTFWRSGAYCIQSNINNLYNACLDSNGIVNPIAASVMFQIANIPDGKLKSWHLPNWYSDREKEQSKSYYETGLDGLIKGLTYAKDNNGNHNENNLRALLYLDKEYDRNITDKNFVHLFNNLKDKDGIIQPLVLERFKDLSKLEGFINIADKVGDIARLPQSGQEFVYYAEQNGGENIFVFLRNILVNSDKENYNKIFEALNDNIDLKELVQINDYYQFSNYSSDLIRYSFDKFGKINPENFRKLLEFINSKNYNMFNAAEYLKDYYCVIRDENIEAYDKLSKYVFDEFDGVTQYRDFTLLNRYIEDIKDKNGIIKPEFVDHFTAICKKYNINSNTYSMRDLLEIMLLIKNDKQTDWDAVETLYRYGENNHMCWQMDRFDMIENAVDYLWDKQNKEISPERLELFKKHGGLSDKSKSVEEIIESINNVSKLKKHLEKNDYGNLYTADDMLEFLRDLKDEGNLNADVLTVPLAENDESLLMYITDIMPTEENAKKYDKIINILKNIDNINYNYKDEMGVSFLEKVIISENSKLLDLIKDKPLEYSTELDYAYKGVQNPEFKEKLKELKLRFPNLEKCIQLKSKKLFSKFKNEIESPFFNLQVFQDILNNNEEIDDGSISRDIIRTYLDVHEKAGKNAN